MEWFDHPYPRPELMNKWSLARHSEVMTEKFETEASKKKFDDEVQLLVKSFRTGRPRVYLSSLFECLYAAAKMEERDDPACKERASFTQLYSEGLRGLEENYIHDPPCWKKAPAENDIVLYCMALTADLAKCVLQSLLNATIGEDINPLRIYDAIAIVRSLTTALDKDSLFHKLNKTRPLPPWILFRHRQYTKTLTPLPTMSCSHQDGNGTSLNNMRFDPIHQGDENESRLCGCSRCSTYEQESYLWINILLEHFAGSRTAGFDVLLDILVAISLLETTRLDMLHLCESVLQLLSKTAEFLTEETRYKFLKPSLSVQAAISKWHRTNQLADASLVGTVTLVAQHLRFIFEFLLPPGVAKAVMATTNRSLRNLLISFQSTEMNSKTAITSSTSSPRAIIKGTERLHVTKTESTYTDATTARAIKEEVGRQMRQQLTKFVSELMAILLPTLQPECGAAKQIKQQSEADVGGGGGSGGGTPRHYDIFYPHPPCVAARRPGQERTVELSPPSAALGAMMRNASEIVCQTSMSRMSSPSLWGSAVCHEPGYFRPSDSDVEDSILVLPGLG